MKTIVVRELEVNELVEMICSKLKAEITDRLPEKEVNEEYLTRNETSKFLKISLPTLSKYCQDGRIKSYRIGRSIRFKKTEIEQLIDKSLRFRPL